MKVFLFIATSAVVAMTSLVPAISFGQSSQTAKIVSAIEQLEASEDAVFSGRVDSGSDDGLSGGGGVMIVVNAGNDNAKSFSGKFELIVDAKNEEMLICSETALPGLAIYNDGEDTITSTTFRDSEFSTKQMSGDLSQLFDLSNLKKYVERCDKVNVDEVKGSKVYTCELSKRLIRVGSGGPLDMLEANIKRIEGRFKLTKQGELESLEFVVARDNPMARLMSGQGGDRVKVQGGNMDDLAPGMREQLEAQMSADEEVTYILKRKSESSQRSEETLKQMRRLAGDT